MLLVSSQVTVMLPGKTKLSELLGASPEGAESPGAASTPDEL